MTNQIYQQQQQDQIFRQKSLEQQEEALIEYYVYQDIQNLINLLLSREAVLQHFQNDQTNPLVTLSNNKIILQLNLSNGIHQDLKYQYKANSQLSQKLKSEKKIALQTLKKVAESIRKQEVTNDPIQDNLQKFMTNYEFDQFGATQFQLLKTNYVAEFNENVLSKIIKSIQENDAQINQVRQNGTYHKPTDEQLIKRAKDYYYMTKEKLNQIYPQQQQSYRNQNGQINPQGQACQIINIQNQQQSMPSNSQTYENKNQKINNLVQEWDIGQTYENKNQKKNNLVQERDIGKGSNPQESNSLNSSQKQNITESQDNIKKNKLIEFLNFIGYFTEEENKSIFAQQISNMLNDINKMLAYYKDQYVETQFAQTIQQQGLLLKLTKIHYYFQLFPNYLNYMRNYSNYQTSEELQKFVKYNNYQGQIDSQFFFQYLFNQKHLIERHIAQIAQINQMNQMNNKQLQFDNLKIDEEEYVWQMYIGYVSFYKIKYN